MSYDVWVYGPEGRKPFEAPLGTTRVVDEHWVRRARRLGLPLLSGLSAGFLTVRQAELGI